MTLLLVLAIIGFIAALGAVYILGRLDGRNEQYDEGK